MEHYSAIKKNEILPFVTWMDLENIILIQTKTNIYIFYTYNVESKN